MSDRGREAYEAMIAAAKAYGVFGSVGGCVAVMGNRIRAWQDAGEWRPTEQHETVAAILVEIDEHLAADNLDDDLDKVVAPWLKAGKPGFPKPVDPYGPEITVDTGGRCPVDVDEVIEWRFKEGDRWKQHKAGSLAWAWKTEFRRLKADHPGESYWHGKRERIAEHGPAGLDVNERIVTENPGPGVVWQRVRSISLRVGMPFRRWLKSDA
jgi:hypothetical protein